jgi:hypothetical protein
VTTRILRAALVLAALATLVYAIGAPYHSAN